MLILLASGLCLICVGLCIACCAPCCCLTSNERDEHVSDSEKEAVRAKETVDMNIYMNQPACIGPAMIAGPGSPMAYGVAPAAMGQMAAPVAPMAYPVATVTYPARA